MKKIILLLTSFILLFSSTGNSFALGTESIEQLFLDIKYSTKTQYCKTEKNIQEAVRLGRVEFYIEFFKDLTPNWTQEEFVVYKNYLVENSKKHIKFFTLPTCDHLAT